MCADGAAVIVRQCLVCPRFLLVFHHPLRAKEPALSGVEGLPFLPQVLVQLLCPVHSTGVCGKIGARIVFRLSTTRRMT